MVNYLPDVSIFIGLLSIFLGVRAANARVDENQYHKVISDLPRRDRWAAYAAAMAGLSTILQAVQHFF